MTSERRAVLVDMIAGAIAAIGRFRVSDEESWSIKVDEGGIEVELVDGADTCGRFFSAEDDRLLDWAAYERAVLDWISCMSWPSSLDEIERAEAMQPRGDES